MRSPLFFLGLLLCLDAAISSIEVIGTGLVRTGTDSLRTALNTLGYNTYHLKEVVPRGWKHHLETWKYIFENDCDVPDADDRLKALFEEIDFTAAIGINFPCAERLMQLYPNAKMIHTERTDAEMWHDSIVHSVCAQFESPPMKLAGMFSPFFVALRAMVASLFLHVIVKLPSAPADFTVTPEFCRENKERIVAAYHAHNEKIKRIVPEERLLVLTNHKDGWTHLCPFLNKEIPNVPFPHANSRKEFQALFQNIVRKSLKMGMAALVSLVLLVIFIARKWWTTSTNKSKTGKVKTK
jgi:hypothetical protein